MIKKLLITLGILALPVIAFAITGENARFDFTNGQPTITDDTSSTCNNQAIVRFDFTNGQPTEVYDTSATCAAASAAVPSPPATFLQMGGKFIQTGGKLIQQ